MLSRLPLCFLLATITVAFCGPAVTFSSLLSWKWPSSSRFFGCMPVGHQAEWPQGDRLDCGPPALRRIRNCNVVLELGWPIGLPLEIAPQRGSRMAVI